MTKIILAAVFMVAATVAHVQPAKAFTCYQSCSWAGGCRTTCN